MNAANALISKLDKQILTLTLNRPDVHNAFNEALIADLTEQLKAADHNTDIRVVLLTATGKTFCAGADLQWMRKMAHYTYEENLVDATALAALMQTLAELSKPTIALVQGPAYGGGAGLIACCDIALAAPQATFCFSEAKLGLVPAIISPYVIKALGVRLAQKYFLTAEIFSAETALQNGLIHAIETSENLLAAGLATAKTLLNNGPHALAAIKKLVREITNAATDTATTNYTTQCIANIRISNEGQEGMAAFLEKRSPNWHKS
jgi:methylglutaconyl-CoA hydratase